MNTLDRIFGRSESDVDDDLANQLARMKGFEYGLSALMSVIEQKHGGNPRQLALARNHFEAGFQMASKGFINKRVNDHWSKP